MITTNRQILFDRAPIGPLTSDSFRLVRSNMPEPRDGEVLLKSLYLSIDAARRAVMSGQAHEAALTPGTLMSGRAIAEVMQSRDLDFAVGDVVYGELGWQEYAAMPGKLLVKKPRLDPLSHLLSVYGVSGLTGYFGVLQVGEVKPEETILISAAAGAVGCFAGQIAKIAGCRTIGIAGSDEKCRWLTEELGFDAAVNYKSGAIADSLKACCPEGVDVYFDNVGGEILEAAISCLRPNGRIVCCGVLSAYDGGEPNQGVRGVPFQLIVKGLTMRGFRVPQFAAQHGEALVQMRSWVEDGRLKAAEDIVEGFENAPAAMISLLHGDNRGKRMVRLT